MRASYGSSLEPEVWAEVPKERDLEKCGWSSGVPSGRTKESIPRFAAWDDLEKV